MHDLNHELDRSKQAHLALLDELKTERQLTAARQTEPYQTDHLAQDRLAAELNARQRRLEALHDMDALTAQARKRVMAGARAEFAALIQQLNADHSYTVAHGQGKRALKKMPTEPLLDAARRDGDDPEAVHLPEVIGEDQR